VEGRFLQADEMPALRREAIRAASEGVTAVFLRRTTLGDPVVLAAGLAPAVPDVLLGVRVQLGPDERHPALLARDLTSLDLAAGGRSVLCFAPPFTGPLGEAIDLCRDLWQAGEVVSDRAHFPVTAAANRARPARERSPLIALDLTSGENVPGDLHAAADMLLWPGPGRVGACRMERV
jgi:alkanesulfonate monooxygenase SsuD/methylene tetrahydromethanopterin reductase-like flavin-dependent oxidoreductase (luciferase family)